MRRLILVSALAALTAVAGACDPKTENVKPAASPSPAATVQSATPIQSASPISSPAASPAKPGASPEVKKDDTKTGTNEKVKPAETPKK